MAFVDGHILRDVPEAEAALSPADRRTAGESLVDVLADIHAVDPDAVGLGGLGRHDGYLARQLKRWGGQYEASKTRERPAMERVTAWLHEQAPEQGPARVVHGDYRLGNCLTDDTGQVVAVLDWEIATLGDPLADLGYVLATWPEPGESTDTSAGGGVAPSTVPGFPGRAELVERYGAATGADLSRLDYYVAFAAWKSACIAEGVYARYLQGALSTDGVDLEAFPRGVDGFIAMATDAIDRA
jgi:aminoglycoside phosphotransferase (APT) family kinase protein